MIISDIIVGLQHGDEGKGSNCFSYSYSTLRINKNERKRK